MVYMSTVGFMTVTFLITIKFLTIVFSEAQHSYMGGLHPGHKGNYLLHGEFLFGLLGVIIWSRILVKATGGFIMID